MRKFLLILSLLACVALSGCGSGDSSKTSSADDSIKGNVEIRDENGSVLVTTDDTSVSSGTDNSEPYVELVLNDDGKDAFFKTTTENIGKSLSIYVNGSCVSRLTVSNAIVDGVVRITGFDYEEQAKDVEISIKTGDIENSIIEQIKAERTADNPVIGRIYMVEGTDSDFEFNVVRFYDDNTFQGVKFTSDTKYASFYGSYELSGKCLIKVTLELSKKGVRKSVSVILHSLTGRIMLVRQTLCFQFCSNKKRPPYHDCMIERFSFCLFVYYLHKPVICKVGLLPPEPVRSYIRQFQGVSSCRHHCPLPEMELPGSYRLFLMNYQSFQMKLHRLRFPLPLS